MNNAAITRDGLALRMKAEDWDAVLRTNLTGAHLCSQQAMATMMRARYGRIINVTSVVAETGNRRASQLCGREGRADRVDARAGLGNRFAQYYGECRGAGFVVSPMTDPLPQNVKDALLARVPLGRMGTRRGDCCRHRISGQRRGGLYYRRRAGRQRRACEWGKVFGRHVRKILSVTPATMNSGLWDLLIDLIRVKLT